jgi:hypothetical protein
MTYTSYKYGRQTAYRSIFRGNGASTIVQTSKQLHVPDESSITQTTVATKKVLKSNIGSKEISAPYHCTCVALTKKPNQTKL